MGKTKRQKKTRNQNRKTENKTLKVTREPHTLETTYRADLVEFVELFYYVPETHTVHSSFSVYAYQMGKMIEFSHKLMLEKFCFRQGYYFANHLNRTGNYAGSDFGEALEFMRLRGYVQNIVPLGNDNDVNNEPSYCFQNDDDDGDELEFDEDGECIGDDTWDYPGSPYLDDDSDIY